MSRTPKGKPDLPFRQALAIERQRLKQHAVEPCARRGVAFDRGYHARAGRSMHAPQHRDKQLFAAFEIVGDHSGRAVSRSRKPPHCSGFQALAREKTDTGIDQYLAACVLIIGLQHGALTHNECYVSRYSIAVVMQSRPESIFPARKLMRTCLCRVPWRFRWRRLTSGFCSIGRFQRRSLRDGSISRQSICFPTTTIRACLPGIGRFYRSTLRSRLSDYWRSALSGSTFRHGAHWRSARWS